MKPCLRILLLVLFFGFTGMARSQQHEDWREFMEQLAEEEMNETAIENMHEELLQLENNPMNLNMVSREQLENFPLLSIEEADAIFRFLERNRPLYTVFELRNVPLLNIKTVEMILPFFHVGEMGKRETRLQATDMLKYGRQEVQFRFDKTLTPRAGYGEFPDSILERYPNRKYRGEDFYTSLRYSFRYRDRIQMGFTAEKDAGEPFFQPDYPKGYDHYGAHLIIHDIGRLTTVALGDYRLSFGQGLVLNNDFMISKSWSSANIARRTLPPKRHFSTAENGFFRGAAAVAELGNFSVTGFYSDKRIDANLSDEGDITSFKVDGLHRTPLEIEKKKNTREQVAGGNINFRKDRLQLGISGIFHRYDKMYNPTLRDYNLYSLRDSSNLNASIDYSFQFPGLIFAGETAIARNGAVATLNTLRYRFSGNLSFSLLHRHYPISYNALYAQAFSEGGNVQNEQGLYVGAEFSPFSKFSVTAYADFVRFPWLKYGIDTPSNAVDLYLLGTYTLSRQSFLEARYKYKQKEKNTAWPDENSRSVLPYATHKFRFRYSLDLRSGWNFQTTADRAHYKEKHFPAENGFMLSQNIGYRGRGPLTGDAYLAWFNADTYDARLYSYERNPLNTFHMPSFYGKGYRLAFSAKYAVNGNLSFSVKFGHTRYFNRDTIGTGTELIDGNNRTDIFTYIRWVF
ncbi:helix-hairpin-helix domain-containing protein [Proteiniphilum sp. X52]|uniref:helix-hairpin-helix domain-containing protein n=1 Tax=Proteiniphilum sp. X52 TaxID=2382159 RepID=UPI000F09CF96|nr:helix-hairpin-helix domain-containing protein [Proteiniphilum sp. X52]RNC66060.1 helix-hairpin-helix domain-containing protein [Proteiniphilum sp. X52]